MPARYPGDRPEASGQAGPRAPPQGHDYQLKNAYGNNVDMPPAVMIVEKRPCNGIAVVITIAVVLGGDFTRPIFSWRTRMYRTLVVSGLVTVMCVTFAGDCLAQGNASRFSFGSVRMPSRSAGGGLLARLNKSPVPTMPGLPTASPLGLISPRLSNVVTIFQKGGFSTQAGRLAGIGVLSPRISPVVALITTPPKTPKSMWTYGLTILSPRAAVAVGMIRGAMGLTTGLR